MIECPSAGDPAYCPRYVLSPVKLNSASPIIDAYLNTDGSVTLTYDITTVTYYGCRDIDSQDTITRSIVGERVDGKWEFKQSIYCEPRSTFEEF